MPATTPKCTAALASRVQDTLLAERGRPASIVGDSGTELTSNAVLIGTDRQSIIWHDIAPEKPQRNGFVESFNGAFAMNC